jgi:hypothetical protein
LLLTIVAVVLIPIVVLCIPLILGIADGIATESTDAAADESAFEATAALITDDTADGRAAESTDD